MIKVGITCDNYKLEEFEKELKDKSYTYSVHPLLEEVSIIHISTEPSNVDDLKRLCQRVELHFKRSN